jgi:uncharacterized membrane protein
MLVSNLLGGRAREAHTRSIAKAISWRITGSIDTFVLSLLITGSFKLAGSIASVEVITKITLYYVHERAWACVPWGRARRGEVSTSRFAFNSPQAAPCGL